jgi:Zn-dependent M28 family amino/carboxypeptidase
MALVQTRSKTRRMMSRDPEQLEQWQDSHQAVFVDPATFSASDLDTMSQHINAETFGKELHDLCDKDSTRFVGTDGNVGASSRIENKFKNMGLKTWIEDLETNPAVTKYLRNDTSRKLGGNVIGLLKGTDLAHEVVVLGAHYDSVNWEKVGGVSPGVDDNGSGSALVQLVARAMSKKRPRRSVMFVGFNAEEEGLVGSEQMAQKAKRGDYGDVKSVLIADEVAYPGSGSGSRKTIFETVGAVPGASSLLDTFAHHASSIDGISGFEVNNHGFGSDHMPFLKSNIPSVLLIERNNIAHSDKWGHSERDDYSHVDFDYGAAMARLMLHTTAALSSPARTSAAQAISPHKL